MTSPTDNTAAADAFVSHKVRIDDLLEAMAWASDDHFGIGPDEIHWGHVGDLARAVELLEQAAAMLVRK